MKNKIKDLASANRHMFIYGYETEERDNFVDELIKEYPIKLGSEDPIMVSIRDFGIPKKDIKNRNLNEQKIVSMAKQYLNLTIGEQLLLEARKSLGRDLFEEVIWHLVQRVDARDKNPRKGHIQTTNELLEMFEEGRKFYLDMYDAYTDGNEYDRNIYDVALPFLELNLFIDNFKSCLENKSYIGLIFDNKGGYTMASYRAVNSLISDPLNYNMRVKVLTDPDKWPTIYDLDFNVIKNVHNDDYLELDDSVTNKLQRSRKRYLGGK